MSSEYTSPELRVLGSVVELTQAKPGFYFDSPGSQLGTDQKPPPGTPGTS